MRKSQQWDVKAGDNNYREGEEELKGGASCWNLVTKMESVAGV